MKELQVRNTTYFLVDINRESTHYPNPNFMNTGMALAGIMDETDKNRKNLTAFKKYYEYKKSN